MSTKQSQDKLDKRAAALKKNLRKRKELQQASACAGAKKDDKNGSS